MFKRILVPLDGSQLAEQALAPATRIAEKFGGSLLLLRVVAQEPSLPGFPYIGAQPGAVPLGPARPMFAEAEAYLAGLQAPAPTVPVQTLVVGGAPPEMIVATAADSKIDLIVMSTHGRAGLTRMIYGSVAEAVLRGASVPILLVPSRVYVREGELERARAAKARSQSASARPT